MNETDINARIQMLEAQVATLVKMIGILQLKVQSLERSHTFQHGNP